MKVILIAGLFILSAGVARAQTIPAGTVIPVRLNTSLSSTRSQPGQQITARVMQDVLLAGRAKIHEGAELLGHVTQVTPATNGAEVEVAFQFDRLKTSMGSIPMVTDLRALASSLQVLDSDSDSVSYDAKHPNDSTTVQIGGDVVYRGGGPVMTGSEVVGKPVGDDGVLVHLRAKPGASCRGPLDGNDALQALWVFSSDACGIYGYPHMAISHAGRTQPQGVILLTSREGALNIHKGAGMLLRVNSAG